MLGDTISFSLSRLFFQNDLCLRKKMKLAFFFFFWSVIEASDTFYHVSWDKNWFWYFGVQVIEKKIKKNRFFFVTWKQNISEISMKKRKIRSNLNGISLLAYEYSTRELTIGLFWKWWDSYKKKYYLRDAQCGKTRNSLSIEKYFVKSNFSNLLSTYLLNQK